MLIILANDDDTIVISLVFTDPLNVVWITLVAFIPAEVVFIIVGIAALPPFTISITFVNDDSIGEPSIAITLLKSLANRIASVVSLSCDFVACDGNRK